MHETDLLSSAGIWPAADQAIGLALANAFPIGFLVVDGQGAVRFANRTAMKIAKEGDGFLLLGNLLSGETSVATARLQEALRIVLSGRSRAGETGNCLSMPRRSGRRPLQIRIDRLNIAGAPERNGTLAMILMVDPEYRRGISVTRLRALFDFTEKEALLVRSLMERGNTADVARDLNLSISTVRTYLKRIFHKTGTQTQADLMRLVICSPAWEVGDGHAARRASE